jgi:hypothetical protein
VRTVATIRCAPIAGSSTNCDDSRAENHSNQAGGSRQSSRDRHRSYGSQATILSVGSALKVAAVIVIVPVDHPEIQVETIATLVSADPRSNVIPTYSMSRRAAHATGARGLRARSHAGPYERHRPESAGRTAGIRYVRSRATMSSRAVGLVASLLLLALYARTAQAREEMAPRGLFYQAETSCPDRAAFAALVLERAPLADLEPTERRQADVQVALYAIDAQFTGKLAIRRGEASLYTREMHGTTCGEVAPAIAFILALALNGQNETVSDSSAAPANPTPTIDVASGRGPASENDGDWGWGLGASVGTRAGIAPSWSLIEQVAVEMRAVSAAMFAPTFRIAVLRAEPVTKDDGVGTTEFSWIAARAAGCPFRFRLGEDPVLIPCAGLDLGAIGAAGRPSTPQGRAADTSSFWADVFGSLRLRFHVFGPVFGELETELVLPLTQYDFAFDPRTPIYGIPVVAAAGSAGLFVQFP